MQDCRRVGEQLFIGEVGFEGGRGEQDERRTLKSALQTAVQVRLETLLSAEPRREPLRLFSVHIVQADFAKLPFSK